MNLINTMNSTMNLIQSKVIGYSQATIWLQQHVDQVTLLMALISQQWRKEKLHIESWVYGARY
jgi:hypothetical protein